MKLAVISDLHLGPGDATDAFGHRDESFLKFLDFLEHNFERVVLLGDIWETLTHPLPFHPRRGLAQARNAHLAIAQRFERPAYTWVHGNHDIVAGALGLAPPELSLNVQGTRLLFTHGHLHDVIVRRARWVSEMGVWMGGWLRRLGMGGVYRAFNRLDHLRNGPMHDASRCTFQRWATHLARARGADVVVTGHTHQATRAEHGNTLFLNSGSCSRGAFSYLGLDTQTDAYGVHRAW